MEFSALRDRTVAAMRNYFSRKYDAADLLDFTGETPIIRDHLNEFYSALYYVSMSSALGSYFCFTSFFGRLFAAFLAYRMFRAFGRVAPAEKDYRVRILVYCAYFLWACVTPWFTRLLGVDKGFVVSTMLAGCVGFGSFGLSFEQPNPLALAYGKAMGYCWLLMGVTLHFTISFFGGDSALWRYQIYWLLMCFMVYVVAYSQEVVLRARGGDGDHAEHALHLYTHFPAFVAHLIRGIWNGRRGRLSLSPWG